MRKRTRPPARETADKFMIGTSSDDAYLPDETKKAEDDRLNNDLKSVTSGTPDPTSPPRSPAAHKDRSTHSETVAWSDEESDQEAFRRLKEKSSAAGRRKTAAASSAKKRKANKNADPRVVSKKPRKEASKTTQRTREYREQTESDSDDDRIERELPDYIKNRKSILQENRNALDNAGLRIPPSFEDVDFTDDERMEELQERPMLPDLQPCAPYADRKLRHSLGVVPAAIAQWLREYQVEGAEFLHDSFVHQKGALLGDDMGLGKTIQVIAFLAAAFGKTGDERDAKRMRKIRSLAEDRWYPRVLLICPGTLMSNWVSELNKWGWWNIFIYHGQPAQKEAALQAAKAGRLEIMITTYSTYRLQKGVINLVDWDCVIADECHTIKERKSEISKAMDEVNALCHIGLSGTIIQNKYEELWTLLNWTNPGRFGPISTWKKVIAAPLRTMQAHECTQRQLGMGRMVATKLTKNLLPDFLKRRDKKKIAHQLPKKSDRIVFCPLTETQQDAYQNYVDSTLVDNEDPEFQAKTRTQLEIALPDTWQELYRNRDNILNFANQEFCGKWRVLKKLLKFWHASGDKVLVFSYSVRLLRMFKMLFSATTAYNVSYLDGSLSYEDRTQVVDQFNADPNQFVFLISTRAGGVGLNITSANKVVVVDPNWNPAYDLQAQDRAYRIGQSRDVEVFRLISAGTIEEIVYGRQIYKQQQSNIGYDASNERRYFSGIQDTKGKPGELFGMQNIFAYHGDNVVLRDIVNKTNVAESRAGVNVVGLDVDNKQEEEDKDEEDDMFDGLLLGERKQPEEDSAMSELATLVAEGGDEDEKKGKSEDKKGKAAGGGKNAIQAILAGAGVQYTHENSEVIGSSKIESRLSRKAEEAAAGKAAPSGPQDAQSTRFDKHVFGTQESVQDVDDANTDAEDDESGNAGNGARRTKTKNPLKYHPPEDVRRRQFYTMAEMFGYGAPDDENALPDTSVEPKREQITQFALQVEGWTQAQRRAALDKFYKQLRET
ncbi:MAG: hypothetical protein M1831_006200 [Alyxoria varia]|nr:MAG: hypothetical protein M1831_006200 [Alyxoria varia]